MGGILLVDLSLSEKIARVPTAPSSAPLIQWGSFPEPEVAQMDPNSLCDVMSLADIPRIPFIYLHSFKHRASSVLSPVALVYLNHVGKEISFRGPSIAESFLVLCIKRSQVRTRTDGAGLPPSGTLSTVVGRQFLSLLQKIVFKSLMFNPLSNMPEKFEFYRIWFLLDKTYPNLRAEELKTTWFLDNYKKKKAYTMQTLYVFSVNLFIFPFCVGLFSWDSLVYPTLTLNSWFPWLHLPSTETTGIYHHTQLTLLFSIQTLHMYACVNQLQILSLASDSRNQEKFFEILSSMKSGLRPCSLASPSSLLEHPALFCLFSCSCLYNNSLLKEHDSNIFIDRFPSLIFFQLGLVVQVSTSSSFGC